MPLSCPAGTAAQAPFVPGTREQQRRLWVFPTGPDPLLIPRDNLLSSSRRLSLCSTGYAGDAQGTCCALRGGKLATRVRPRAACLLLPATVLVRTADRGALTLSSFGSRDPKFKPSVKQTLPVPLLVSFALPDALIIVIFLSPSPSF